MTPQKIRETADKYRKQLEALGVRPRRMPIRKYARDVSLDRRLAHALYLLVGIEELSRIRSKARKIHRHLSFAEALLWDQNFFTIEEFMNQHRPT